MTVIIGLAWLWWALCGLGAVIVGLWAFGSIVYQPAEMNIKHRDRWLVQHFGKAGRDRWMENFRKSAVYRKACEEIDDKHRGKLDFIELSNLKDRYITDHLGGVVRRTANGRAEGFVELRLSDIYAQNPWGNDSESYCEKHASETTMFFACYDAGRKHHGEPVPMDWLAAGFWDPVRRDDGVLVDPMADVLIADVVRKQGGTCDSGLNHFQYALPDGIYAKVMDVIRAYRKRDGKEGLFDPPLTSRNPNRG